MDVCKAVLTVYFEAPFWAAVYEREHGGKSEACKITFGAEPKDYEVFAYLLQNYRSLQFSPPVACGGLREKSVNPKRIQREINGQMQDRGIGTKAQRALMHILCVAVGKHRDCQGALPLDFVPALTTCASKRMKAIGFRTFRALPPGNAKHFRQSA